MQEDVPVHHENCTGFVCVETDYHSITAPAKDINFFTLLSSISDVIENHVEANYAAANVFLDSFAALRRARGQAVCSVDLDVIEDFGIIAEVENLQNVFDTRVFRVINSGLSAKIL